MFWVKPFFFPTNLLLRIIMNLINLNKLITVDLPARLFLMARFLPSFKLMFSRYLWIWKGFGTEADGPACFKREQNKQLIQDIPTPLQNSAE